MYTIYTATMANAHWPLAPMANGHWPFCCIKRYTCYTHGVKAFQSYTAKTAENSAIQRYTVYSYTSLYTIHPLQHPSGQDGASFPEGRVPLPHTPRAGRTGTTHQSLPGAGPRPGQCTDRQTAHPETALVVSDARGRGRI